MKSGTSKIVGANPPQQTPRLEQDAQKSGSNTPQRAACGSDKQLGSNKSKPSGHHRVALHCTPSFWAQPPGSWRLAVNTQAPSAQEQKAAQTWPDNEALSTDKRCPRPPGKAATSCPDVLPREGLASNNLDMNLHQASTRQDDQTSRNDIGRQLHHQCMDARQPAQSEYRASGSDAVQDNDDTRRRAQSTASNTAQQE